MKLVGIAFCLLLSVACGTEKVPEAGPDYGPEEGLPLAAKDDSATAPASMKALAFGEIQQTTFTATRRWRAFTFAGKVGQKVALFVDGLRKLDTVAYVYRVSATTGRPYGRALASNDDTTAPAWKLLSNTAPNPQSSSINSLLLKAEGTYALVATTYQQAGRGSAEVQVRLLGTPPAGRCVATLTARPNTGVALDYADLQEGVTGDPPYASLTTYSVPTCVDLAGDGTARDALRTALWNTLYAGRLPMTAPAARVGLWGTGGGAFIDLLTDTTNALAQRANPTTLDAATAALLARRNELFAALRAPIDSGPLTVWEVPIDLLADECSESSVALLDTRTGTLLLLHRWPRC